MLAINEDLLGPEAITDPYTYYGRLREEDPIHWNPRYAMWVITRYTDVVWALRHPEVFSSEIFLRDPHPPLPPILETDQALYEFNKHYLSHWFLRRDAPDHLRMRRVVHAHFNPKYIAGRFRTLVQEVIHALLAEVEDRGRMEVLQDFAAPLPVLVIAQWLGLPQQDREFIRRLSRHLLALDQENPDRNQAVHTAITTLVEYITPLVEERLTRPRDDLLSVLAAGEKEGSLSRDEVLGNTLLLLVAGHQTTINLIGNGILALLRHPDYWVQLQRDATRTARATEEVLRYDAPVKRAPRIAAADVELHGQTIRQGERVLLVLSAANRDPRQFADPDTFDITRDPNLHVAFGGGIHHCLGANLARLEGQEAFRAITQRFAPFSLATDRLEYQTLLSLRGLKELWVSWS
jgi:cytochrome P450